MNDPYKKPYIEYDGPIPGNEYDQAPGKTGWPYSVASGDEPADMVNHPRHYQFGKYEVIDVIEDWFPDDPHLFTAVQYLARASRKGQFKQDLEKAVWYINRRLAL